MESLPLTSDGKRLAGESASEEVKVCKSSGVNISDIFIEFLTPCIIQGTVGFLCIFIYFAPSHKFESSGSFESGAKTSDACKRIKYFDNMQHPFLLIMSVSCWIVPFLL